MRSRVGALAGWFADLFTAEWEAEHPGTGRHSEHASLWRCVAWFAGETLEWLARRWFVPVLALAALLWFGVARGRKEAA